MLPDDSHQASHCFAFEQDFVGGWRCIPLCLRRKLDLAGIKLKLGHWNALEHQERQLLVDWPDDPASLEAMADHIRQLTAPMAEGMAKNLAPARDEPWQAGSSPPADLASSSEALGQPLSPQLWAQLSELERFALAKLSRPGHDHHNLRAALEEVLR